MVEANIHQFMGILWIRCHAHGDYGLMWYDAGTLATPNPHDKVIKWKHFPCYWAFVRGIHRSPVDFAHKGQWHRALIFFLIGASTNSWVTNKQLRCWSFEIPLHSLLCHCYDVFFILEYIFMSIHFLDILEKVSIYTSARGCVIDNVQTNNESINITPACIL